MVNNACYAFTNKYHYASGRIKMSSYFYYKLRNEMVGNQLLALLKQNSVRGCVIDIDDSQTGFTIVGRQDDKLVVE